MSIITNTLPSAYVATNAKPRAGAVATILNAVRAYADMRRVRAMDSTQLRDAGLSANEVATMTYVDFLNQPRRM
jgi:uncharacterized protein YjiS (DUF1127 family)